MGPAIEGALIVEPGVAEIVRLLPSLECKLSAGEARRESRPEERSGREMLLM